MRPPAYSSTYIQKISPNLRPSSRAAMARNVFWLLKTCLYTFRSSRSGNCFSKGCFLPKQKGRQKSHPPPTNLERAGSTDLRWPQGPTGWESVERLPWNVCLNVWSPQSCRVDRPWGSIMGEASKGPLPEQGSPIHQLIIQQKVTAQNR